VTIVYLHGFNSGPASHKANVLKACMEASGLGHRFICPALPHRPDEAARAISGAVAGREPSDLTFVGSSLGGYYATWFTEKLGARAVLINPSIRPYAGLETLLGKQKNLYTGEEYELTRAHLDGWRSLEVERVDPERYLLLLETGDELLDWREAARKYEGARMVIRDGGDHTLRSFPEHLARILRFAGLQGA
jgi:predicted esterase YcpF (UPF0227 family)